MTREREHASIVLSAEEDRMTSGFEQAVDDLINTYRERDNIMKNLNEED